MPFKRPTLKELDDRIRNDIAGRMRVKNSSKTASLFRRSVVAVLSRVYSGVCHGLYGFLNWLAQQRFVHSMEIEFLDSEGMMYDMPRKPADFATGVAAVSGAEEAVVPVGAICQRDDGAQYEATAAEPISGGAGTVTLKAMIAGMGGNTEAGTELRLVNPVPGVNSVFVVDAASIRGGVDAESNDDYRERILDRKREPPHGGNAHDYEVWAKEVAGVTRAWCLPLWMGLGTVGVMFTRDYDADIIPTTEQVEEVEAYIEPRRPVTADVYVFAPVRKEIDVTLQISPDDDAIRDAVEAEINDFIIREGAPGGTLRVSRLSEAISAAVGEHHHYLTAPFNDIVIAENEIPVMGEVVFVESTNALA